MGVERSSVPVKSGRSSEVISSIDVVRYNKGESKVSHASTESGDLAVTIAPITIGKLRLNVLSRQLHFLRMAVYRASRFSSIGTSCRGAPSSRRSSSAATGLTLLFFT